MRLFVAVEIPEAVRQVLRAWIRPLEAAYPGARVQRRGRNAPLGTDNGNAILDCAFGPIGDPVALDASLRSIHGVVATGLCGPLRSSPGTNRSWRRADCGGNRTSDARSWR